MPRHFVIESLSGYEAARRTLDREGAVWHTTSPYLLDALPRLGEEVRSLERDLDQGAINALALSGYDFTDALCARLNELCPWRDYGDLQQVFAQQLNQCFFATFYKGLLLENLLKGIEGGQAPDVVCVGDPEAVLQAGLNLIYGRLDTLYAFLVRDAGMEGLSLLRHTISPERAQGIDRAIKFRKMDFREKLLSLLNNTPSSFMYKAWRNLASRGLYPFKRVGLLPGARHCLSVYHECELIDESFLGFLLKGARIGRLGPVPALAGAGPDQGRVPDEDQIREAFFKVAEQAFASRGLEPGPLFRTCARAVCSRLMSALGRLHAGLNELTQGFEDILARTGKDSAILTGALTRPEERLFYCYCREKGWIVAAVEHGVTAGLSRWHEYNSRYYAMSAAQIGVYHNRMAVAEMEPHTPEQERLVAGVPQVTSRTPFPRLQRRLARRWLGIGPREHVVMYVADLARNNYACGPYLDNDLQYKRKTEDIVTRLAEAFPDSTVMLKLYPTQRYADSFEFSWLAEKYPNVRIIKDMDFRFVRYAADIIFTTSTQSTLGWVSGADAAVVYLEFEWAPSFLKGLRLRDESMPGLDAAVLMHTQGFMQGFDRNYIARLLELTSRKGRTIRVRNSGDN